MQPPQLGISLRRKLEQVVPSSLPTFLDALAFSVSQNRMIGRNMEAGTDTHSPTLRRLALGV